VGGATGGTSTAGGTTRTTFGGSTSAGGTTGKTSTSTGTGTGGLILNSGPTLAFPGAQGFGKKTTGGRNGKVVHVTNLNDSGAGSFRDAVSAANRIVVFDVGGYIPLKTAVLVNSNITIAGQTAPGEGIGFRGGEISFAKMSNIIMRYVRVRPGSETASDEDDALSLYRAKTVAIDHSSFEFAPWNNIDGVSDDWEVAPVTDITFQDCLIADPTGQQFGAHTESVSSQWSWYRNIFANSHNRNPLAKVNNVFVNNLLYNTSAGYTTHTSTAFKHDILNNYFVFGPASTGTDNTWFQIDKNQSIYAAGNLKDSNLNGALDGTATSVYWYQGQGTILSSAWSSESTASKPLDPTSAARVAVSWAGTMPRDQLDSLIINQVMTLGKGSTGLGANTVGPDDALYTSQAQTGLPNNGYGSIAAGTRPKDSDEDGMSDAWENATGSNPNSDDAMTKAADGYALVEHYINWLAEPHASTTVGTAVDVDLAAYTKGFSSVLPSTTVAAGQNGTVAMQADKHTARFEPAAGFKGLGTFTFTVTGSDNTTYSNRVTVLVAP
jgi:pectate lyase